MLDRLPLSLQHHILLEWLSPTAVCRVARAGSDSLRRAVTSSPSAFRAAEGEVIKDGCARWFFRQSLQLVLWTTVESKSWRSVHRCNGKLHRDGDLPAEIWSHGARYWYQRGKLHRDGDQPAVCLSNGTLQWFQNGQLHRDGGLPAFVRFDGLAICYEHGKCCGRWSPPPSPPLPE